MRNILLLDTSVGSQNKGDDIIIEYLRRLKAQILNCNVVCDSLCFLIYSIYE